MAKIICEHVRFSKDKWEDVVLECMDHSGVKPVKVELRYPSRSADGRSCFVKGNFRQSYVRACAAAAVRELFGDEEWNALLAFDELEQEIRSLVKDANQNKQVIYARSSSLRRKAVHADNICTQDTADAALLRRSIITTMSNF